MLDDILCLSETALNRLEAFLADPAAINTYINAGITQDIAAFDPKVTVTNGVAVIDITGSIVRKPNIISMLFGGTSSSLIKERVRIASADKEIKAILLNVDSPGGDAMGVQEAADAIFEANKTKPVFAHVSGLGASAAFWLASQAGQLSMEKSSQVGSIGAFRVMFDQSKMFEEKGVKPIVIKTGEFKAAGIPGTEITDGQIADAQRMVNAVFSDFKDSVLRGRNMNSQQLDALATGGMFTSSEAKESGLVDRVDSIENVLGKIIRGRQKTLSKATMNRRLRASRI